MYALADGRRLALTIDTAVSPRDDGDATPLSISPSAAGLRRLLQVRKRRADEARAGEGCRPDWARAERSLAPATTEPSKHCGAGSASLAVDPVGNVFPCVQWRVPLGNLHERRISEIWRSSSRLPEVREQASAARRLLPALGLDPRRAPFCPGLARQRSPRIAPPPLSRRRRNGGDRRRGRRGGRPGRVGPASPPADPPFDPVRGVGPVAG